MQRHLSVRGVLVADRSNWAPQGGSNVVHDVVQAPEPLPHELQRQLVLRRVQHRSWVSEPITQNT